MDYLWVKSGQRYNSIWNYHPIHYVLLACVPTGFFLINRRHCTWVAEPLRVIVPIIMALVLTAIWAFCGLTVHGTCQRL
jgi:hypothetical protein